jgi:hypothetical protein
MAAIEKLQSKGLPPFALLVGMFAAAKLAIHLLTATGYGYLCDELYAIDLSKHLAFGYVDLPPLVPALLALNRAVLGDSLLAIHLLPALAGSATLVFVCLITREFGGRLFATALSALAFITTPFWLMMDSIFGYDAFDQLALAGFLYVLIRLIRTEDKKVWLFLGLTAGIACLTKVTILYLGPGLLIAFLCTKYRRHLITPWPWLALGLFLLVFSPYLLWEYANHWPTLEYWGNYQSYQLVDLSITDYLTNIFLGMNPLLSPLFLVGLYATFRRRRDTRYVVLGIMFCVTFAFLFILKAKYFMLAALFVPLLAAGSAFVEEKLSGWKWRRSAEIVILSSLLLAGVVIAPPNLPLLPPPVMTKYADSFGFLYKPIKAGPFPTTDFPPILENRLGWDKLAQIVAAVYDGLPEEERADVGIYADWFGPAGAINHFGPVYGLPRAVSGHLTYYLWGPGYSWNEMIVATINIDGFRYFFGDIQQKALFVNEHASPVSTNIGVYVCKAPIKSAKVIWTYLKLYK